MKNFTARLLLIGLFLGSCHKSNMQNNQNSDPAITAGSWRITLFTDSGKDETSDFSGYTFVFTSDGVVKATKGALEINGTWNRGSKFNLDMGVKSDKSKPIGELTKNWDIIFTDATHILLGDDNESSGEKLSFTKN